MEYTVYKASFQSTWETVENGDAWWGGVRGMFGVCCICILLILVDRRMNGWIGADGQVVNANQRVQRGASPVAEGMDRVRVCHHHHHRVGSTVDVGMWS